MSTITTFIQNHVEFIVSVVFSLLCLVGNVVQFIEYLKQGKVQEAINSLPEVIRAVEDVYKTQFGNTPGSNYKKAMAESLLDARFGSTYRKNKKMFDDALEDILNTPQKKGGSVDVS